MARKCRRFKRVRVRGVRGRKTALRCAKFSGKSRYKRRKHKSRSRKPYGMAKRGSKCLRFGYVKVRGSSKRVRRCRKFSQPRRRGYSRRRAA